jgi:hypothetical protein
VEKIFKAESCSLLNMLTVWATEMIFYLFDRAVCGVECKTSIGCALQRSFIADGQVTWGSPMLLRFYGVLCMKWYLAGSRVHILVTCVISHKHLAFWSIQEPKSKKKGGKTAPSNAKKAPTKKGSSKKAPNKKAEKKPTPKKRKSGSKSDESSSEDEPLSKKTKAPPTVCMIILTLSLA